MIHGRTRIKLYNPISGNVTKDIVSENTFQGAVISEGLRNLGYAKASLYNNADNSIIANPPLAEIIGGILLLDSEVNADSQFVPLGVKMTGNGAYGVTNSSAPIELGSFDNNASDIQIAQKKIKLVYTYSQTQAIGKIASVCLTSRTGGYIGIGNPSEAIASTLWDLERNAGKADVCPQTSLETLKTTYNKIVCNGCQYSFELNGANLTINKFRLPLKNASLLDCIPESATKDVSALHYSWMGGDYIVSAYDKKIYLTPRSVVKTGTFYMWEYDTETENITEKTFTFGFPTINVSVANGKVFAPNNSSDTFGIFDLDGTPFDTVECGDFNTSVYSDFGAVVGDFGNHALFKYRNVNPAVEQMMIYDKTLKKAFPTNMQVVGFDRTQGIRQEETSKALTYTFYAGGASSRVTWAINNPIYLATINNLQTPVIKDGTSGMIVEYTLTES
jgi:hypothetical protein